MDKAIRSPCLNYICCLGRPDRPEVDSYLGANKHGGAWLLREALTPQVGQLQAQRGPGLWLLGLLSRPGCFLHGRADPGRLRHVPVQLPAALVFDPGGGGIAGQEPAGELRDSGLPAGQTAPEDLRALVDVAG
eukprot:scaffold553698_cov47-Prasinocladus_malaysianus.AAC.2